MSARNFGNSTQSALAWTAFIIILASVIAVGATEPVAWVLMCLATFMLFFAHVTLEFLTRQPRKLGGLFVPAILVLGVCVWSIIQRMPIVPTEWHHPVWALDPGFEGVVSADPEAGRAVLMRYGAYGMLFWMAVCAATDRDRARAMIRAFAVVSSCLALYGIYAFFTENNPVLGDSTSVVTSTFVNRNSYATYAVFGLIANLAVFLQVSRQWDYTRSQPFLGFVEGFFSGGWIWMMGGLLCGAAVLMTQSRAGGGAAVIAVAVFFMVYRSRGAVTFAAPFITIGVVLAAVAMTSAAGVLERLIMTTDENGRFAIYPRIVDAIHDRPLLGHGLGAFQDAFRPYVPFEAGAGEWDMAHNSYLELAFELGLPAAAAFYLALLIIAARMLKGLRSRQRGRGIIAFSFACFSAAAFHSLFDFSLQMPAIAATFAWILGLGYAQSFHSHELSPQT